MSYIGLDQPGVEPSGDDTSGINRSHVSRELFLSQQPNYYICRSRVEGGGGGGTGGSDAPSKITKL